MAVIVGLRVEARRRVSARVRTAVIAIDLALVTGVADRADALVRVYEIAALATVLTRLRGALVDVDVAVLAGIALRARTMIVVHEIDAQSAVMTLAHAVVYVLRAVLAREATSATASAIDKLTKLENNFL